MRRVRQSNFVPLFLQRSARDRAFPKNRICRASFGLLASPRSRGQGCGAAETSSIGINSFACIGLCALLKLGQFIDLTRWLWIVEIRSSRGAEGRTSPPLDLVPDSASRPVGTCDSSQSRCDARNRPTKASERLSQRCRC